MSELELGSVILAARRQLTAAHDVIAEALPLLAHAWGCGAEHGRGCDCNSADWSSRAMALLREIDEALGLHSVDGNQESAGPATEGPGESP